MMISNLGKLEFLRLGFKAFLFTCGNSKLGFRIGEFSFRSSNWREKLMGSNCYNEACRGMMTPLSEWKKGWRLKSGGFFNLCFDCRSAYENSMFCETFHMDESGWRECRLCGKRIHCGCIASRHLYVFIDYGGIWCTDCSKHLEVHPTPPPIQDHGSEGHGRLPVVVDEKTGDFQCCEIITKSRKLEMEKGSGMATGDWEFDLNWPDDTEVGTRRAVESLQRIYFPLCFRSETDIQMKFDSSGTSSNELNMNMTFKGTTMVQGLCGIRGLGNQSSLATFPSGNKVTVSHE